MEIVTLKQLIANIPDEAPFFFRDTEKRKGDCDLDPTIDLVMDLDGTDLVISGFPKKDY